MGNIFTSNSIYGIVHTPLIPMRRQPDHRSEQVSQALFGELYRMAPAQAGNGHSGNAAFSANGEWVRIQTVADGYEGWVPVALTTEVSEGYAKEYLATRHPVLLSQSAMVKSASGAMYIPGGSVLPFWEDGAIRVGEHFCRLAPDERVGYPGTAELYDLERLALQWLHVPYVWGGRSVWGFDCSGFVQFLFRQAGLQLPRDASQQVFWGTELQPETPIQAGDVAFFVNGQGRIHHVGLLTGRGGILHASGTIRHDQIDRVGIFNESLKTYTHRLQLIKRILPNLHQTEGAHPGEASRY